MNRKSSGYPLGAEWSLVAGDGEVLASISLNRRDKLMGGFQELWMWGTENSGGYVYSKAAASKIARDTLARPEALKAVGRIFKRVVTKA